MAPHYLQGFDDKRGLRKDRRVKMIEREQRVWPHSQLLFADDTALVAESAEQLQCLVAE